MRLLIYGAEDHIAAMKLIEDFARKADIPFHGVARIFRSRGSPMAERRFSEADYEHMAELRERGLSIGQIARRFDCSQGLVQWQCLRLGADPPNAKPLPDAVSGPLVVRRGDHEVRRFTPEEDAKLLAMEMESLPLAMARRLRRAPNSVRGRLMTLARREARREPA